MSRLLDENGLSEKQFLEQYNPGKFARPSVTVDIVIFTVANVSGDNYRKLSEKELRILLIRRGGHPYLGQWALPGGFVRPDETVGEAANRELIEETGINGEYLEQLYTFSAPERDPRTWVISCAHMALIDSKRIDIKAGSDASDAQWFVVKMENTAELGRTKLLLSNKNIDLSSIIVTKPGETELQIIENNGLAFDHAEIIVCAVNRLRAKLEYTDLAFSLMPETFTLTELQQVYEAILGKPLFKAAFRRKLIDLVQETGQYTSDKGHRPAKLYKRTKQEAK
jgi:ADP-ribose pyrophosphatase YjhB (NUDIX family)